MFFAFFKTVQGANFYALSCGLTQLSSNGSFLGANVKKNDLFAVHPVAQLSGQKQKENGIDILNKDHVNYDVAISPVVTEYKSTVYYNANVKSKSAIGRFFVGDHVTAHM